MADRRLQIFHAVATHLNFTRAAEALFMTQPAVTVQIRQIEDEYRMRLLERSPQGVRLTPAGQVVFDYAKRILAIHDELEAALADLSDEIAGPLQLGAATGLAADLLPPVLTEFNSLYPKVSLTLLTGNASQLQQQVAAGALPLALIDAPPQPDLLEQADCGHDELVLICDTAHPLARQRSVTARAIADYECVTAEPGAGDRQVIEAWFAEQGIDRARLKIQMASASPEALKRLVANGVGYALVSRLSVEHEPRLSGLRPIPLKPPLRRHFHLVFPKERYRPRVVRCLGEFLQRRLREHYA